MIVAAMLCIASWAQEKRYGIEKVVLKTNTVMMGQTIASIQYIADWGSKESSETFINMQGQMFTVFSMIKDGYMYSANMTLKQGTKISLTAVDSDFKTVNYLNLTKEVKEKFHITELGSEKLLGKDCKKYSVSYTVQGQTATGTTWIWEGLSLKTIISAMGNTVTSEASEILEGKEVAKEKFELPEGINFMEVKPQ
jgi:hypothetical protein